jgi:predicted amidohydrolase
MVMDMAEMITDRINVQDSGRRQTLKAALAQFDIVPGNVAHNENVAETLIRKSAELGAELVVLPELWNIGYDLKNLPTLAQDMRGSSVRMLARLAKEYGIYIFGGTIGEKKGGKFFNTMLVFNDDGEIISKYRKLHLFPNGLEEDKFFTAGDEWGLVETPWGTFGLAVCYDLRVPVTIQNLALRGADTIVVPAQWPTVRADHWYMLNQARAIDHQLFMLSCNRTGKDKSGKYPGCSVAVDPLGKVLTGGWEASEPGVLLAELDYSVLPHIRGSIPVYKDRMRIMDEIDDSQL